MKVGEEVGWKWANGIATGTIESIHHERVEIESNGSHIVRNGSKSDPAVCIRNSNNVLIVKLQHEVKRIT